MTQRWEQMLSDDFVDTDGLIDALRSNATVMSPFAHDLVPGSSLGAKKQWGDAASQDWDAGPENASEDVSVVVKDPRPVMAHGTGEAAGCRGRESPSSLSLSQRERERSKGGRERDWDIGGGCETQSHTSGILAFLSLICNRMCDQDGF